jgi:hypothetical protein
MTRMKLTKKFARGMQIHLFLALLTPAVAGQLALTQEQPAPDRVLIIDVYSGAVAPDAIQEKEFLFGIESLKKGREPDGAWLPKVIHIERVLSENDFRYRQAG